MKTIIQKKYIACLLVLSIISLSSFGQDAITLRSNTEGFHIGVGASYKHWISSYFNRLDELEPTGIGGGINLGYGLNQHLELFASYDYHGFAFKNEWDDYEISTVGIGVRYNFGGTLQAVRPFGELAYNYQSVLISPVELNGQLMEYKMKGGSLAVGGGVNFFVTPKLAINARAGANFGKFSSFLIDNDGIEDRPDIKTFHFGIGLNYFFN
jgi:opacity protein-like surface antigen